MLLLFDIGGTKIHYIVLKNKEIIEEKTLLHHGSSASYLHSILSSLSDRFARDVKGIVYSVAGRVINGELVSSPNLSDLVGRIQGITFSFFPNIGKVIVENDANCFALSQYYSMQNKGVKSLFGLIWGTGIGGGFVYEGKVVKGNHGITGEIGHVRYKRGGRKCNCGKRGCYEAYLGGWYLDKVARKLGKEHLDYSSDLFYSLTFDPFSNLLKNIVLSFDPEVIVLGGGVGSRLPYEYLNDVVNHVHEELPFDISIIIKKANSSDQNILGCRWILRDTEQY